MCSSLLWISHSTTVCSFLLQGCDGRHVMFLWALRLAQCLYSCFVFKWCVLRAGTPFEFKSLSCLSDLNHLWWWCLYSCFFFFSRVKRCLRMLFVNYSLVIAKMYSMCLRLGQATYVSSALYCKLKKNPLMDDLWNACFLNCNYYCQNF